MVHRDYSKRGESVRVFYYADRVEVHSPGLLLPGITVEQMERGVVQSKLRNPALASLLRDLPGYKEPRVEEIILPRREVLSSSATRYKRDAIPNVV